MCVLWIAFSSLCRGSFVIFLRLCIYSSRPNFLSIENAAVCGLLFLFVYAEHSIVVWLGHFVYCISGWLVVAVLFSVCCSIDQTSTVFYASGTDYSTIISFINDFFLFTFIYFWLIDQFGHSHFVCLRLYLFLFACPYLDISGTAVLISMYFNEGAVCLCCCCPEASCVCVLNAWCFRPRPKWPYLVCM